LSFLLLQSILHDMGNLLLISSLHPPQVPLNFFQGFTGLDEKIPAEDSPAATGQPGQSRRELVDGRDTLDAVDAPRVADQIQTDPLDVRRCR